MRKITFALGALVVLFAIQFIRPAWNQPPHQPLLQGASVPSGVAGIFERACQDCHSNNTHWPWYARVAPLSFMIARDVDKGRAFLNLSEWNRYSRGRKLGFLSSMTEATRNRKMPPRIYTAMHPDSSISDTERQQIAAWAHDERNRMRETR